MGIEEVRGFFNTRGRGKEILEFSQSSATVLLAAEALGVEAARIAKTMTFRNPEKQDAVLVVTAGDGRIDNSKFRKQFGYKARMLTPDEVYEQTGHEIGGVCPFALKKKLDVYLDDSLKRFETVYPACGSSNSAIELTPQELEKYSSAAGWVDVCRLI